MTTRKEIKKQHRLQRQTSQRAFERARTRNWVMSYGLIITALVVVVVVVGVVFAVQAGSGGGDDAGLPAVSLGIGDNFFQPDVLTVQAGQTYRILVLNRGQNTHDVWFAGPDNQSATDDDIRSKPISGGGSASLKLMYDKPGTYYFSCTFHGGQGGKLIVQ